MINLRITYTVHAELKTIIQTLVKFQIDRPKTVGGVAFTRYLTPIHLHSIEHEKVKI